MKKNLLFLFSSLIIITSCKEKNEVIAIENPKESIPKIKSIEEIVFLPNYKNDTIQKIYAYNTNSNISKLIEVKNNNSLSKKDSIVFDYYYFKDSIIEKKTKNNEVFYFTHLLNENGLIVKSNILQFENSSFNDFFNIFSKKKDNNKIYIYRYNNKNKLEQISIPTSDNDTIIYNLEYINNNINKIICISKDYGFSYNYFYSAENISIGKENFLGILMGKQNDKLIKEFSGYMSFNNYQNVFILVKYTYTFDEKKRVKTQTMSVFYDHQLNNEIKKTFSYIN